MEDHQPVEEKTNNEPKELKLDQCQLGTIFTIVKKRENVIVHGTAGTGKSIIIEECFNRMTTRKSNPLKVQKVALTGIAAIHVNGQTIHRWGGFGHEKEYKRMLYKASRFQRSAWESTDVLIVDEASMLDAQTFENLEKIARFIRRKNAFFGGMQIVLVMDALQLKPCFTVGRRKTKSHGRTLLSSPLIQHFDHLFNLGNIYRQKEERFQKVLNEIRIGKVSPETIKLLKSRVDPWTDEKFKNCDLKDKNLPLFLYCLNEDADRVNNIFFNKLNFRLKKMEYKSVDCCLIDENFKGNTENEKRYLKKSFESNHHNVKKTLTLKTGARVMLIFNVSSKLVNGMTGEVVGFRRMSLRTKKKEVDPKNEQYLEPFIAGQGGTTMEVPVVRFDDRTKDEEIPPVKFMFMDGGNSFQRIQIPLKLSWASSIHKVQSLTLKFIHIGGCRFMDFMFFVALSRVISLDGLTLDDFHPSFVMIDQNVLNLTYYYFGKDLNEFAFLKPIDEREEELQAIEHLVENEEQTQEEQTQEQQTQEQQTQEEQTKEEQTKEEEEEQEDFIGEEQTKEEQQEKEDFIGEDFMEIREQEKRVDKEKELQEEEDSKEEQQPKKNEKEQQQQQKKEENKTLKRKRSEESNEFEPEKKKVLTFKAAIKNTFSSISNFFQ